jgi:hypothetical protein
VLVEKIFQFKLPAAHFTFQQARRRALARFVLLGRAAIFCHKQDNGLWDSPWAGCPCRKGGDEREKLKSQLHTCMEG